MSEFFKRIERKYIINEEQCNYIKKEIKKYMIEDSHGQSKICNVYLDTDSYDLVRNSLDKPIYKDKLRIRSYNTPEKNTEVFLEIKRKYEDIVTKRRIKEKSEIISEFLKTRKIKDIKDRDSQVLKELQYYFSLYDLKPTAYVSYDRCAYYSKNDNTFRITIDTNIIARTYDLDLEKGSYGTKILDNDKYLLETKTSDSLPLWFINIMSEAGIHPGSFSKYGVLYQKIILINNQ